MDADLVGPARLDIHLQQGGNPVALADAPDGHGGPAPAALRGHPLAVRRVPSHGGLDPSAVRLRIPVNEGLVGLLHLMALELPGQPPVGLVGFGHHQQSGGLLVETVDDPGAQHAADPREIAAVVQQGVDERPARMAGGRMDDHPRRFVDTSNDASS